MVVSYSVPPVVKPINRYNNAGFPPTDKESPHSTTSLVPDGPFDEIRLQKKNFMNNLHTSTTTDRTVTTKSSERTLLCYHRTGSRLSQIFFKLCQKNDWKRKRFGCRNLVACRVRASGSGRRGKKLPIIRRIQYSNCISPYHPSNHRIDAELSPRASDCPKSGADEPQSMVKQSPRACDETSPLVGLQPLDPSYHHLETPTEGTLSASGSDSELQASISTKCNGAAESQDAPISDKESLFVPNTYLDSCELKLSDTLGFVGFPPVADGASIEALNSTRDDYSLKVLSFLASASSDSIKGYLMASSKHFQDKFEHHQKEMYASRRYVEMCDEKLRAYM